MSVQSGGASTILQFPGIGGLGTSISGSMPLFVADDQFKPNFRQFDFQLEDDPPSQDLVERIWKVEDNEAHWGWHTICGGNMKSIPIILLSFMSAGVCNFMHVRVNQRPMGAWRWSFFPLFGVCWFYHNMKSYFVRERHFQRDFQRNQCYAQDEVKRLRDEQRVREAIYESQFIHHPVAEYRVKEWQTANRFN